MFLLFSVAFVDIQSVRRRDNDHRSPLPGFSLLAIDTASRCHYFSLPSDESRDELARAVNNALFSFSNQSGTCSDPECACANLPE